MKERRSGIARRGLADRRGDFDRRKNEHDDLLWPPAADRRTEPDRRLGVRRSGLDRRSPSGEEHHD